MEVSRKIAFAWRIPVFRCNCAAGAHGIEECRHLEKRKYGAKTPQAVEIKKCCRRFILSLSFFSPGLHEECCRDKPCVCTSWDWRESVQGQADHSGLYGYQKWWENKPACDFDANDWWHWNRKTPWCWLTGHPEKFGWAKTNYALTRTL